MAGNDFNISIMNGSQNGTATAPPTNPLAVANQVVISTSLVILMVGMGCTMTLNEVWKNLRRPTGIIIGACCQFILMPFLGWSLANIVELSPEMAIGTISIATCPGGAFSNILTFWTRGDTVLSICMTTCSTIIGIGMMPLNLYVYTRTWAETAAVIPYVDIVIALCILLFPCALGMFILKKWPRAAEIIAKISSVITMFCIVIVVIIITLINPKIYTESRKPYIIVIIYPLISFGLGYIIPWLSCQSHRRCRTIGFETGVQNGALALTLINLMISRGLDTTYIFQMMVVPSLHSIFVIMEFSIICGLYRLYWKRTDAKRDLKDKMESEIPPEWVPGKCLPDSAHRNVLPEINGIEPDDWEKEHEDLKYEHHYQNSIRRGKLKARSIQGLPIDYDNTGYSIAHAPGDMSFEKDKYPIANGTLPQTPVAGIYNPAFTSGEDTNVAHETCV